MEPLMTEVVGRITYGPHEPTSSLNEKGPIR